MKISSLYQVFGKAHANLASRQLNRPIYRRQRGASAIEYVMIAAVISIVVIASAALIGPDLETLFDKVETAIDTEASKQ
ncbi:Flp family type IVb pilin [Halomonas sp. B23F22_10]|uniref:Flp family type IVb pilin n=1 Tax=Halomonas sp. B23F22_10 TaxID=3459515 RepID=UPI00373F6FEE